MLLTHEIVDRMPQFSDEFGTEFRNLLIWRRDVRRFRNDSLADGLLEELLELARLARRQCATCHYELALNAENLFNRQRYFFSQINGSRLYPGQPINVFTTLCYRF
jgi:hypothetical protein